MFNAQSVRLLACGPLTKGRPAGPILGGVALLDMTPGDLRLGQSQQLAVQGLALGCLGAAAGD